MVSQHLSESLCCLNPRHHPKCMTEDVAVTLICERIHTFFISLGKKIEEVFYMAFMNKFSVVVGTKKFAEVKGDVFIGKLIHQSAEVVSIYIKAR